MSAAPVLLSVWASGPQKLQVETRPPENLAFYRKHTEALLRQYMRKSFQIGRTPSLLDNRICRGKVSSRPMRAFDDVVHFVLDIEKCLKRVDRFSQDLIARIVFQDYSQVETARMTGYPLRTVVRKYAESIDALTALFLDHELLKVE